MIPLMMKQPQQTREVKDLDQNQVIIPQIVKATPKVTVVLLLAEAATTLKPRIAKLC